MNKQDINIMNSIVSKQKFKYTYLDSLFKDRINEKNICVPINIMGILSDLDAYKETVEDILNFELNAAISIVNLFAHYKHYYQSRNALTVTIVGYVRDSYNYQKYKDTLSYIEEITNYFKDIYLLKKIDSGISLKALIAIFETIFEVRSKTSKAETCVHIYSPYQLDKILLCAFYRASDVIKLHKDFTTGIIQVLDKEKYLNDTIFKGHYYYQNSARKAEIERLSTLLGIYFKTLDVRFKEERKNKPILFKKKTVIKKIESLDTFLSTVYSVNDPNTITKQFIDYIVQNEIEQQYIANLMEYENTYDYFYQNATMMKKIVEPIFTSWKQKLKDHKLEKDSERYKLFVNNELQINWLT